MSAQYHKRLLMLKHISHRKGNEVLPNLDNNNNNNNNNDNDNNMYMTNQADIDHLIELPTMRCL